MKRLVLVGAGHAHAQVLLEFAQRRIDNIDIVLVSPVDQAPYSGMVPGWLAGHYAWEECCLDFAHLCRRAGARLHVDTATGIDSDRSELILAGGERLGYDWLSLNIGSTLVPPASEHPRVLAMRPLSALRERWDALLDSVGRLADGACYRVVMIGGGPAGVESVLAAHRRLTQVAPRVRLQLTLATDGDDLMEGMARGAARRLRAQLARRDIAIVNGFRAEHLQADRVVGADGRALAADAVLWATGAEAYGWPGTSGLAVDARGFVRIDANLRSLSHPDILSAGDCAQWDDPLPKAGVYAVRMGPVLAHNLRAVIRDRSLQAYRPQRRTLVLIGSGDAYAVAAWGPLAWQGEWVWKWKQRIDRRFVARYNTSQEC